MASQDLSIVLNYFDELAPPEQFIAFRTIRHRLGRKLRPDRESLRAEGRAAGLDAIAVVAKALNLAAGEAPTSTQFNDKARELGLAWDAAKIHRRFGSWRIGRDSYLGKPLPLSSAERESRKGRMARDGLFEDPLRGIEIWLKSEPKTLIMKDYDDWRKKYNASLPQGRLRLLGGSPVSVRLGGWRSALAEARNDPVRPKPRRNVRQDFCRGPHQICSRGDLVRILERTYDAISTMTNRGDFPFPVVKINGNRLWLEDDVIAYKEGRYDPSSRHENELRAHYMTLDEVALEIGATVGQVNYGAGGKVPLPVLVKGSVRLWLAEEVRGWRRPTK